MDDRLYRFLAVTAVALTLGWVAWSVYDSFFAHAQLGDKAYLAGERYFEDGRYPQALGEYEQALKEAPRHVYAWRGKARTLLQLERYPKARAAFNEAIALAPAFAGTYANRGILYDRMGEYEKALQDYEQALALDPERVDGPGWLSRFFRLQVEKPPGIADRARYLREQLAKPESERMLRLPEQDAAQRPYKK